MKKILWLAAPFVFLSLTGCVDSLFYWGKYEDSLIERYIENNNAQTEIYLHEIITEAEANHQRVPPGVCADYGFSLYQRGDKNSAMNYFAKEKSLYPESIPFMSKLIERVSQQSSLKPKENTQ